LNQLTNWFNLLFVAAWKGSKARRALWPALVFLALAASAPSAFAQGAPPERFTGRVIQLYGDDIVVDLSAAQGAEVGTVVELWRPLKLKHPITGEELADEFVIGKLRLTQVRATLSLARPLGKLEREPQPGDIVVARAANKVPKAAPTPAGAPATSPAAPTSAPGTVTPPPAPEPGSPPRAAPDPTTDEIHRLLDAVKGKGVRARILAYEGYVRQQPNGRYAAVLWEEAQKLRELVTLQAEVLGDEPLLVTFDAPEEALAGSPISLGVELAQATGAVLHARAPEQVAYTSTPMIAAGDGYFVATVPGSRVKAPGLEYFIEAVKANGKTHGVAGAAESPLKLQVVDAPQPTPPPRHDSVVSVATDYANWNLKKHNDYVLQTEGFVGMRFRDTGLRAARTGFGVYRGRGGSLEDLDEKGLEGRDVGLTYGYLEGEAGITHFIGLIGRGVIGLQRTGVAGGMQLHVRLGNDLGTNLTLGGEVLGTVGLRGITQLELATFPRFPILLRTEVTNQPAGTPAHGRAGSGPGASNGRGDIGARGIAQLGFRILPTLAVAARASYQGRTIHPAGPGVGGGVTYTW
jgi:hypothetical protein